MFSQSSIASIDKHYFSVLSTSAFVLVVRSKNTGHYWALQSGSEYPSCTVFHRHRAELPYHLHGHSRNLTEALEQIRAHDFFQLNGRRR